MAGDTSDLLTDRKIAKIGKSLEKGELAAGLKPDSETAGLTALVLKEAGIDPEFVARRLFEGLSAEKTVVLEETLFVAEGVPETDNFGKPISVKRAYNMVDFEQRRRYAGVVMQLLTPEGQKTGPQIGQINIVQQVPDEMLSLRGEALQKYYLDRTRAIANGLPPPDIEGYREKSKGGVIENVQLGEEYGTGSAEETTR